LGTALYAAFEGASDADDIVVSYDANAAPTELAPRTTSPLARTDNGCVGMAQGDDFVVLAPGAKTLAVAPLAKPSNLEREIDAAVGLGDSFLVRTFRGDGDTLGALQRVTCPGLAVTQVAKGDAVINLGTFERDDKGGIWAVDRYNGGDGSTNWRLMKSVDDGKTFAAVKVPAGFQASKIALKKNVVVVAPPKGVAVLLSTDRGATFALEPLDLHDAIGDFAVNDVHVTDDGILTLTADCNYLVHRRARLMLQD
jgi:hypothetical protein